MEGECYQGGGKTEAQVYAEYLLRRNSELIQEVFEEREKVKRAEQRLRTFKSRFNKRLNMQCTILFFRNNVFCGVHSQYIAYYI